MKLVITQRHATDSRGCHIDSLENGYLTLFQGLGCQLFPIPNLCYNVPDFVNQVAPQGIVLSGGGDISPSLYSGASQPGEQLSAERERIEYALLGGAVLQRIPVLGICRGMQLINVYFGGSLVTDIATMGDSASPLIGGHQLLIDDARLAERVGATGTTVNSYHTQGVPIEGVGEGLAVLCRSPRFPIAEAIRHVSLPIAGVQWHPERNSSITPLDRFLCESFLHRTLYWEVDH